MSGDEIEMMREQLDDLRISYKQALATIEDLTRQRDKLREHIISMAKEAPHVTYRIDL